MIDINHTRIIDFTESVNNTNIYSLQYDGGISIQPSSVSFENVVFDGDNVSFDIYVNEIPSYLIGVKLL